MCGIAGLWPINQQLPAAQRAQIADRMGQAISHRGPDGHGTWVDPDGGPALAHRRLAIVELSPAGHQPMVSASGRWVVSFNGEIYNHRELRTQLGLGGATPAWRGRSDTETLLAAVEQWGVTGALERCNGMFAIALWDRAQRTLVLARDRMGEKPLYYGWAGDGSEAVFLFGSELEAFRAHPAFAAPVCRGALAQYLRFMYVPAPRSIYQGVYKLEPGCLLTVHDAPPPAPPAEPLRPGQRHGSLQVHRWWSLAEVVEAGAQNQLTSEAEALRLLEEQLAGAVARQAEADVPLGAFLSGGVDSSTVVALMQRHAAHPVRTYTIGFDEPGYNEAPYAAAVAQHLGTVHHELRVTAQSARDLIPSLPHLYSEPFADSSQLPTHLLCRATRENVTVALSGDGGDELFGGYTRYAWGPRLWARAARVPASVRRSLGRAVLAVPTRTWDTLAVPVAARYAGGVVRPGEKLHKLAERVGNASSLDDLYRGLVSERADPAALVRGEQGEVVREPADLLHDALPAQGVHDAAHRMMYRDTMTYLPDDILAKVDRAAMAVGLETRVPLLDVGVVQLAWRLPLAMKLRNGTGKWALRQLLYEHVPRALIERPKAGFAMPIGQWLRGPMREWADALLDESRLHAEGYLHAPPIRALWRDHLRGHRDHTPRLWSVLMFQAWSASLSAPPAAMVP